MKTNQDYALFHNRKNEANYFSLLNLDTKEIIWEQPNLIAPKLFNNHLFSGSLNKTILNLHSFKTGKVLWQLDLSQSHPNSTIQRFIGASNGVLVVGLSNDMLLGINTQNGTIIWERKGIIKGKLIENDIIHSFMINYSKISLQDGKEINSFVNREYFEQIGIETQRDNYVKVGKHIITTDSRKGIIGAFNTETFQFDWVHTEPGVSFPGGSPMEYKEPYLFVQDNKKTVHVFEHTKPNVL